MLSQTNNDGGMPEHHPYRRILALLLAMILCITPGLWLPMSATSVGASGPVGFSIPKMLADLSQPGHFYNQLDNVQKSFYTQLMALKPTKNRIEMELVTPFTVAGADWHYMELDDSGRGDVSSAGDRLRPALDALLADHPELFWLSEESDLYLVGNPQVDKEDVTIELVWIKLVFTTAEVDQTETRLSAALGPLLDTLTLGDKTTYEQIKMLYKALRDRTEYIASNQEAPPLSNTAIGPLAGYTYGEKAVYNATTIGYARAFKLVCDRLGIPCIVVCGDGQMWNLVQMPDSEWYAVNVGGDEANDRGEVCVLVGANTMIDEEASFADTYIPSGLLSTKCVKMFNYPQLAEAAYTPPPPQQGIRPVDNVTVSGPLTYGNRVGSLTLSGDFCVTDSPATTVNGTLQWVNPNAAPDAGSPEIAYCFIPNNEDGAHYEIYEGSITVTVAPAPLTITPKPGQTAVYNATKSPADPLLYEDVTGQLVGGDTTATVLDGTLELYGADVGNQPIVQGSLHTLSGNYSIRFESGVTCAVTPLTVQVDSVDIETKAYDGTTSAVVKEFHLSPMPEGEQLYLDYVGKFPQSSVGSDLSVSITGIKPHVPTGPEDPYVCAYQNYKLLSSSFAGATGTITKLVLPAKPTCVLRIPTMDPGARMSFSLEDNIPFMPGTPGKHSYGALSLADPQFFDRDTYGVPDVKITSFIPQESYNIAFTLDSDLEAGASTTATLPMQSENYKDTEVLITFLLTGELLVPIDFTVSDPVYSGKPCNPIDMGSLKAEGQLMDEEIQQRLLYQYSGANYPESATPPTEAGFYSVMVTLPNGNSTTPLGQKTKTFTIRKAPLSLLPKDKTMVQGRTMPTLDYSWSGLVGGDTANHVRPDPLPILSCTADGTKVGTFPIRVSNVPASNNYSINTAATGTLTVTATNFADGYYTVSGKSVASWYSEDIVLTPTGKDGFALIGSSAAGAFTDKLTFSEETASGSVPLFFQQGTVYPGPTFTYKLDKTPPTIKSVSYAQILDQAAGRLTVDAVDSLSGVAGISLVGPSGSVSSITPGGGSFPVAGSGTYTVTVTDAAGHTATQTHVVTVRTVTGVAITDGAGTPITGSVLGLTESRTVGLAVTGTAISGDYTVAWSSSNPLVAQVDDAGKITAKGYGHAVITVSAMGKTASINLEVAQSSSINQPGDGSAPSAEVPDSSLPDGIAAADIRLVVSTLTAGDFAGTVQGFTQFSGMDVQPLDIRLVSWSDNTDVSPTGTVTVSIPFPEGSDASYSFAVLHIRDGTPVLLDHQVTDSGLLFHVSSFSPFIIGYKPTATSSEVTPETTPGYSTGSTSGSGGSRSQDTDAQVEASFWAQVLTQVKAASSGDTVKIGAGRYSTLPAEILWAAQGRAVTLRITLGDREELAILGRDIPVLDKTQALYTGAQLLEMVELIKVLSVGRPSFETGETHAVDVVENRIAVATTQKQTGLNADDTLILAETLASDDKMQETLDDFVASQEEPEAANTGVEIPPIVGSPAKSGTPATRKMLLILVAAAVTVAAVGLVVRERGKTSPTEKERKA